MPIAFPQKNNEFHIDRTLDYLGMYLLLLCSLGYFLNARRFAELHIQFSFLDFPIFIGEIILFFCFFLLTAKYYVSKPPWNHWHAILFLYIIFVVMKALIGYQKWGPLALRDAALMYYPLCALLGYSFYRQDFFDKKTILVGVGALSIIFQFFWFYEYFLFTTTILAVLLIRAYPEKKVRWLLWLLLILVMPYEKFFKGSRTMLVGMVISILFCLPVILYFAVWKLRYKVLTVLLVGLVVMVGIRRYFDRDKLRFFFDVDSLNQLLMIQQRELDYRKQTFVPIEITNLRLYNPEGVMEPVKYKTMEYPDEFYKDFKNIFSSPSLDSAYGNIAFRLHIWRDMIDQFLQFKPFWGFDFGKPLRSPRIEMLGLAVSEWLRDGWIGAHNSFLYMIYKTGAIGGLFILVLLGMITDLIRKSLKAKSVTGILLCAILIFWIVVANFLLIFELPYNAIPFWTLLGMALAYLQKSIVQNVPSLTPT